MGWYGLDRSGSGYTEHGIETSGCTKCSEVAAQLAASQEGLSSISK
jgi:hypothetical protein